MSTNDYEYKNLFPENVKLPTNKELPKDIKPFTRNGNHIFSKNLYFVSVESKAVYLYTAHGFWELSQSPASKISNRVNLIDDNEVHTSITLSKRFFERMKQGDDFSSVSKASSRSGYNKGINIYAEIVEAE